MFLAFLKKFILVSNNLIRLIQLLLNHLQLQAAIHLNQMQMAKFLQNKTMKSKRLPVTMVYVRQLLAKMEYVRKILKVRIRLAEK